MSVDHLPAGRREFTEGPLYRAAVAIYGLLAATVCFLVACAPVVVASTVTRSWIVLVPAAFCVGPAVVALLYTMRAYLADRDCGPVRTFWRGYRLGWRQTLIFWVPYVLFLAIAAVDLQAGGLRAPMIIIAVVSLLWAGTVLLIISHYNFRIRDVLRLAVWVLIRVPQWLVGLLAILFVAGALSYLVGDAATVAASAVFGLLTVLNARRVFTRLDAFTVES